MFTTNAIASKIIDFAQTKGFGYKTANLTLLKEQGIEVPSFTGISSNQIQTALGPVVWNRICEQWKQVQQSIQKDKFLSTQTKTKLEEIRALITNRFNGQNLKVEGINEFLQTNSNTKPLIIRSTGMEDSDELSNAGGNLSVPYVSPNTKDITKTIAEVVGSYFGEKSIQQRLDAGDKALTNTNTPPFIPVLIQEMVEPKIELGLRGTITYSGVAITGSDSLGEGISKIVVGIGSNEGVVASIVPVDTIVVTAKGNIYSDVKTKDAMIAPNPDKSSKERLIQTKTPEELATKRALPKEVILELKKQLDQIHKLYKKPMDVEYTIQRTKDANGKDKYQIYILQARPLIEVGKDINPTFVSLEKEEQLIQEGNVALEGESIITRKDVRFIEDAKEEVITAENIVEALKIYQAMASEQKVQLKGVIINTPAPSLSHEAIVFSGAKEALTVIAVNNKQKFEEIKKVLTKTDKAKVVMIDAQNGKLIETKVSKEKAKEEYVRTC